VTIPSFKTQRRWRRKPVASFPFTVNPQETTMNDAMRSALCSLDDAAISLAAADPGINSATRRAKSLIVNLSNSLRYGLTYTPLMMASAVLVESAVRIEEQQRDQAMSDRSDRRWRKNGEDLTEDSLLGGGPGSTRDLRISRVQGGAPRIGSGELV